MALTRFLSLSVLISVFSLGIRAGADTPGVGDLGNGTTGNITAKPSTKSDFAEFCTATDGSRRVVRVFGNPTAFYLEAPKSPGQQVDVKKNYLYKKDPAGAARKSAVEFDTFVMMAEAFGGTQVPAANWANTFETVFNGKVEVIDDQAKSLGSFEMQCSGALLEYN